MVSLRTTALKRRISLGHGSATAIYILLLAGGYLSWKAVRERAATIALIREQVWLWNRQQDHLLGAELSSAIAVSLRDRDYLSWWARTWGARSVSRGLGL